MTLRAERIHANPSPATLESAAAQVLARCDALARFSEIPGQISRSFLCDAMHPMHALVRQWMRDADMIVRVDSAGNIIGHYPGRSIRSRTLLIGSHLDTVPSADKYDGILGVLAGIAVVSLLRREALELSIDVVGFSDQEGVRFGRSGLGSAALAGTFDRAWLDLKDQEGTTLADAIRAFDLRPEDLSFSACRRERLAGYLELRVEQGLLLDPHDSTFGVVTALTGHTHLMVRIVGQAGHAGTLSMTTRKDALVGAAEAILAVEALARSIPDLSATVGQLSCIPNSASVVPGEVRFSIELRHPEDEVRRRGAEYMLAAIQSIARQRGLGLELLSRSETPAVRLDLNLTGRLIEALVATGNPVRKLVSGASHDAVNMAALTPVGMLFVRGPGGASCHPDEQVRPAVLVEALRVMHAFVRTLGSSA
jgi:allantoate deiminase